MKPSIVNRIKSNWTLKRLGKVAMTVAFTLVIAIFLLAMLGTVVQAAGLVDDTVNVANEYSRYPLENYQLDFYVDNSCLLYTSPSPRDVEESRMPSSA